MYNENVMKHFKNPHNMGQIKDADAIGEVGNPGCGDVMKIYIKVEQKDDENIIGEISFETFGCVAAIANSSVLTDLAKGKKFEEALKIDKEMLVKELGGDVPKIKLHCSFLAADALADAIYNYLKQNNLPISEELEEKHKHIEKEKKVAEEKRDELS